jgi:hypothetical protein
VLASNTNSPRFSAAATPVSVPPARSLVHGQLAYALGLASLVVWHFGRQAGGPFGTVLRGELATVCLGLSALGALVYTLLFAFDFLGLRRRNRQYQTAPRWRKVITWIVLPVLAAGYGFGVVQQLGDASAWPASSPAVPAIPVAAYPAAVRQHFMNACITAGGTQPGCACKIDAIQAHYRLQDFQAVDARAQPGEKMPAELVKIVAACNPPAAPH